MQERAEKKQDYVFTGMLVQWKTPSSRRQMDIISRLYWMNINELKGASDGRKQTRVLC